MACPYVEYCGASNAPQKAYNRPERQKKGGGGVGGEGKNDQMYKMVSSQEIKQLTFQVENNLRNMISVTV